MYLNNSYKLLAILLMASCNECSEYKVTDQVYFDMRIDGVYAGRITFGLFGEVAPRTCKNFKQLATKGIDGKTYVGTKFHTAIEKVMILGGDIVNNDGTGSISIYGKYFDDENFIIKPESGGILVMANNGSDTNGCQFFITTLAAPWLEGKNVVFGKVLKGARVVHTIEHLKTDVNDRIIKSVVVGRTGLIKTKPFLESSKNYEITLWAWIKAGWFPLSFSVAILGVFHYLMLKLDKLKSFE